MMEPTGSPLDPALMAALVVRAVDDIDRSSDVDRDTLLTALLCAAWPGEYSQNQ